MAVVRDSITAQGRHQGGSVLVLAILIVVVVASALGVVYAKFQSRVLFNELQELRQERDKMDMEWGQLQLEQSTWATHGRVERIARERLGMMLPAPQQIVVLKP